MYSSGISKMGKREKDEILKFKGMFQSWFSIVLTTLPIVTLVFLAIPYSYRI